MKEKKSFIEKAAAMKAKKRELFSVQYTEKLKKIHAKLFIVTGLTNPAELHRLAVTELYFKHFPEERSKELAA